MVGILLRMKRGEGGDNSGSQQRTVFGIVELISRRCVVDVKLTGALRTQRSLTWADTRQGASNAWCINPWRQVTCCIIGPL